MAANGIAAVRVALWPRERG